MKKIALCSILAVIMMPCIGWAAGSCGPQTLSYVSAQDPDDDEFLYQNQTQFNLSKQGWENTKHYNSGEGKGYECDNSGCPNKYVLSMPAGHCFKGDCGLEARKYTCYNRTRWIPITEEKQVCKTAQFGDIEIGHNKRPLAFEQCSGYERSEPNKELVVEWELLCRKDQSLICKPIECVSGYRVNQQSGRCEQTEKVIAGCDTVKGRLSVGETRGGFTLEECRSSGATISVKEVVEYMKVESWKLTCYNSEKICDPEKRENIDPYNPDPLNPTPVDQCANYKLDDKAYACCTSGNKWTWATDSTEVKVDRGYYYGGYCTCVDKNKIWDGSQCVAKVVDTCAKWQTIPEAYACCKFGESMNIATWDDTAKRCNCFDSAKTWKYDNAVWGCVADKPETPVVKPDKLKNAEKSLDKFFSYAESNRSAWKTAEGKFNATRLASDLTAGVVLGTVGGVVSGVVIKKNQVKKGFEALYCAVGGQKVADYGDEFEVGLAR